jgi:hypothetical protein
VWILGQKSLTPAQSNPQPTKISFTPFLKEHPMNGIVYLVGAVVIIIAVLSFFGLR